jgi:hypothetical protein
LNTFHGKVRQSDFALQPQTFTKSLRLFLCLKTERRHPGTAGCREKGAKQTNTATGRDKRIGGVNRAEV